MAATHLAKSQHGQGLSVEDVAAPPLACTERAAAKALLIATGERTSPMLTSMAMNNLILGMRFMFASPNVDVDTQRPEFKST
jgi:hypothetical protein